MTEIHQQHQTESGPTAQPQPVAVRHRDTHPYHDALESVRNAFEKLRPLTALLSDRKSAAVCVIEDFLDDIADDVLVARVPAANSNAIAGMREITRAVGFDPKGMSIEEMESAFTMFLSYQRAHNKRTIICFEEAPESGQWVLDRAEQFVKLETDGDYGLMVLLSGRTGLTESLEAHPLSELSADVTERIHVERLMEESIQRSRQERAEANGAKGADKLSGSRAAALLSRLRRRVPDAARKIYVKYFDLHEVKRERSEADSKTDSDTADSDTVMVEVVKEAAEPLPQPSETQNSDRSPPPKETKVASPVVGRLIVHISDDIVQVEVIKQNHVLIGRSKMCDLRLASQDVSRHHAMVVNSPNGTELVDLRSTNGTRVDGSRIQRHPLRDNDAISIGGTLIRYVANA